MSIMFLLILISLVVAIGFLAAFLWATGDGQFDDDYTPSVRMLFDDVAPSNYSSDDFESSDEGQASRSDDSKSSDRSSKGS